MSVKTDKIFLPDFCSLKMLIVVFFLAELLAFLLTLAIDVSVFGFLSEFAIRSLLALWIALMSASVLCSVRQRLSSFSHLTVGIIAFVIIQLITLLVCWLVVDGLPDWNLLLPLIKEPNKVTFYVRVLGVSSLVSLAFLRYLYVLFQWKQQIEARAAAKLDALQARMRPHFLFNSLNSIASLTRLEPETAEALVEDLAELLRSSMQMDQALLIPLEQEINLVKLYLAIEQHRLNQRLRVNWQLDNIPMDTLVPPLSLQPIVENAVYYGVEPSAEGADILIKGEKTLIGVVLTVRNTRTNQTVNPQRKGNKSAMNNLIARIAGCYAGDGKVHVQSQADFFQVEIEIPYWTE